MKVDEMQMVYVLRDGSKAIWLTLFHDERDIGGG